MPNVGDVMARNTHSIYASVVSNIANVMHLYAVLVYDTGVYGLFTSECCM